MSGLDMVREIIGQINNLRELVTVNGKQYKYDQKSKSYKAGGRTFTPSQLKAQLEGQSYTAPKDRNIKIKKTPTTTKTNTSPKTSVKTKVSQAANNVKNVGKNLKIKKIPKSVKGGAVSIAAGLATELGIDRQITDRIARRLAGQYGKMTMQEFRANRDKLLTEKEKSLLAPFKAKKRTNNRPTGAERNKIVASRKRVTTTGDYEHGRSKTYKGKTKYWNKNTNSWQTNKPGPLIKKSTYQSTTPKSTTPTRAEKLKKGMRTWRVDPEEQKKLNKGETNNKVKIQPKKTDNKDLGGNTGGTTTTVTKPKLTPAQKEERARKKWLKKTRNSPAQKSGAFDPKKLYELHKYHQGFKKARKEGTLKEWRKKNKRK